jgi:hypothetical protein
LTGTGNSAQVLGTVVEIMKSFLTSKKASIRRMTFAAKEDSRQGLYARMIKRLLPNWNLDQSGEAFVLTRPGGLVFWVYSVEAPYNKIPAVKVKANTAREAEQIVLTTMPKFKGADLMGMGASKNKPNLSETIVIETAMMGKIEDSGKIIRILKKAHTVPFSDEKNWLLVDMDPAKGNKGLGIKWIPADTRFEWVRPYRDTVDENFADGRSPGRNSQLNTLHDPQRMASAVAYLTDYYDSKEEAYQIIDAYTASVDKLITQGGAVYRAVWVAPGQKPKLKQPGLHWTLTPQSAEEYLQSEAGEYAAMDMDLDDQPHAYILSATVGPNNITNHGVNFAQQHHEQEVRIVDPKQAQIKVVKQVGMTENFADGKNPQDKGDSKRHGVPTKASVSTLRKVAKQGGRKGQLAHWMANMKSGRAKNK